MEAVEILTSDIRYRRYALSFLQFRWGSMGKNIERIPLAEIPVFHYLYYDRRDRRRKNVENIWERLATCWKWYIDTLFENVSAL